MQVSAGWRKADLPRGGDREFGLSDHAALEAVLEACSESTGAAAYRDSCRGWSLAVVDRRPTILYRGSTIDADRELDLSVLFGSARRPCPRRRPQLSDMEVRPTYVPGAQVAAAGTDAARPSQAAFSGALIPAGGAKVAAGQVRASVTFDPQSHIFLTEHRLQDRPLMPAVVGLELIAELAVAAHPGRAVRELRNFEIVNGLWFQQLQRRQVVVSAAVGEGSVTCRLESDRPGTDTAAEMLLVAAGETIVGDAPSGELSPVGVPAWGWTPFVYPEGGDIYHGPTLRCFQDFAFRHADGWARLVAPANNIWKSAAHPGDWILPCSLLDACLVACGTFAYSMTGLRLEIPQGLGRVRLGRRPHAGEACTLRFNMSRKTRRIRGSTSSSSVPIMP